MSRLIDIALAPLYATVGVGDVLTDPAARAEALSATHRRLDSVARRGKNVTFDALTSLPVIGAALGARIAHHERDEHGGDASGSGASAPFGLPDPLALPAGALSSVRSLLRGRAPASANASFGLRGGRLAENDAPRAKRTAASRTSAPAPSGHRQPMSEYLGDPPARMTSARTVRPSGVEAASTATRAARRAALRAESE